MSVDESNDIYLVRRGELCSPVCSGFAQNILKRVILSEQRVASRTFGRASGNIASSSKSENCQDNFRDLLRFILSFWHKSNILCCVGFKYNLFVDPSVRGQATPSPFLTTPSKKVRLLTPLRFVSSLQANSVSVFAFVRSSITISRHSAQDDRLNRVRR